VLAVTICAYTGFLISALIRFPLINTAVLPALFVASGLSAGTAASSALAVLAFGGDVHGADQHLLHRTESMVTIAEMLFLFMIAVALMSGNAGAQHALSAFTDGVWAAVFWIGAVGIGFGVPILLRFAGAKVLPAFYASACASVAGMMCLRLFIIYAGQLNPLI
jgi:protein NrfD